VTNLSSAALAVLDAFDGVPLAKTRRFHISAALRAAAEQIEDLYCESDVDDSNGVVFAMRHLVLIAAELEGAP
jgi:hypothetical protein